MAKTPEAQLKKDVYKFLRASGWYVRIIAVGVIPGRTNPSKGLPDCVCIKNGRVIFLELKSPKGKISEEQEEFIADWTFKGGEVYVVRSLEDAKRIILRSHSTSNQNPSVVCRCNLLDLRELPKV